MIRTNEGGTTPGAASTPGPHDAQRPVIAGAPLGTATHALVLVHGRGGTAEGMLPIARAARAVDAALIAPVAAGNSWYPQRFLAPVAQNEPWLSSALARVGAAVDLVRESGIPTERIVLVGFSQGACLTLEYAARAAAAAARASADGTGAAAARFGGVAALAGALIGDPGVTRHDEGTLGGTPVLLACGTADPHIPVASVRSAAEVFGRLGADVDLRLYAGLGHDIVGDEIDALQQMVARIAR